MNRPVGYIDVDRLQAETTLEAAAARCGVALDAKGTGPEVRIDCFFGCPGDHNGRSEVAIRVACSCAVPRTIARLSASAVRNHP